MSLDVCDDGFYLSFCFFFFVGGSELRRLNPTESGSKHQDVETRIVIQKLKQNPVQASMWNKILNHRPSRPSQTLSTYEQEGVKLLTATV